MFFSQYLCQRCEPGCCVCLPLSSYTNLCYQVRSPAVCHLNMALNKMSLRSQGTSAFSRIRTQQHNLLPSHSRLCFPFQIQDGGDEYVCVCLCSSHISVITPHCVIGHLYSASWKLCLLTQRNPAGCLNGNSVHCH